MTLSELTASDSLIMSKPPFTTNTTVGRGDRGPFPAARSSGGASEGVGVK